MLTRRGLLDQLRGLLSGTRASGFEVVLPARDDAFAQDPVVRFRWPAAARAEGRRTARLSQAARAPDAREAPSERTQEQAAIRRALAAAKATRPADLPALAVELQARGVRLVPVIHRRSGALRGLRYIHEASGWQTTASGLGTPGAFHRVMARQGIAPGNEGSLRALAHAASEGHQTAMEGTSTRTSEPSALRDRRSALDAELAELRAARTARRRAAGELGAPPGPDLELVAAYRSLSPCLPDPRVQGLIAEERYRARHVLEVAARSLEDPSGETSWVARRMDLNELQEARRRGYAPRLVVNEGLGPRPLVAVFAIGDAAHGPDRERTREALAEAAAGLGGGPVDRHQLPMPGDRVYGLDGPVARLIESQSKEHVDGRLTAETAALRAAHEPGWVREQQLLRELGEVTSALDVDLDP